MKTPKTAAVLYLAAAAVAAFAQTNLGSMATGSGVDISGTWRYGGQQDAAYDTANGALVDYGGFPLNEPAACTR